MSFLLERKNMIPWMSEDEIELILKYLKQDFIMLEWGSGGSTLLFPKYVKKYFSIEHDKEWYDKIKKELVDKDIKNAETFLVEQDLPRSHPASKREEFKHYVEFINSPKLSEKHFDAILVDGRARPHCAIEALKHIDHKSIVFIHDFFQRPYYFDVLDYYEPIDQIIEGQSLIVLRKK